MKKIILFAIFLICACVVKAQNPTGVPQLFNGKWYKFNQFLGVDSALLVNNKDTNWLPRQPALVFWQNAASDTSFWVYNGKKWNKVGVVLDTTSLSNRINLRVKYSDTASMLSPYLRKLDTTSLSNRINLKADKATTLTINGDTYDLSANRTWTIPTTDTTSLSNRINLKLNISDTAAMLSPYLRKLDTASLSNRINLKADKATTLTINGDTYDLSANRSWTIPTTDTTSLSNRINLKLNISDTAAMLSPYQIAINARVKYTDTASMLAPYLRKLDTASLSNRINLKQDILSLTTTGNSGPASLTGATLNIPQYQGLLTNPITGTGTINTVAKFTSASAIGNSNIKDDGNAVSVSTTAGGFGALQVGSYNGNILMNTTNAAAGLIFQNTSSSNKLWDISSFNNDLNFNESNIAPPRVILKAGGDVIVSNLVGSGTRMVVANASGVLSSQAIIDTTSLSNRINTKLNISDTAAMLSPYLKSAVTSVGLSMPNAFSVANSPITSTGTIAVTGAGTAAQYIRGDGVLATYNPGSGGGGSSQVFYFNGGVASGVAGYQEMSKVANTGAAADFSINADGYIASFLTGAGVPNQVSIPSGNWNFEIYMSSSSAGGSPSFYVELYKYNGTTFTLIASSSANPEYITNGTAIDLYTTALSVPATTLLSTDRLAVRVYVTHSSKTITMHTQNGHLSEVITTFTTGLSSLNGLIANTQYFSTGTSGSDFNISSVTDTHTFNLPTASSTKRGALSSADWSTFNGKMNYSDTVFLSNRINLKLNISDTASMLSGYQSAINSKQAAITLTTTGTSGAATFSSNTLNIPNYSSALSSYVPYTGATGAVNLGAFDLTVNGLTIGKGGGAINTNTAVGNSALSSNTTGISNTAVGFLSLSSNTTGIYNTASGDYALFNNTTGSTNTAVGQGAGTGANANTTGGNNIFIGYNSVGTSATDNNKTWIGNSSTTQTWLGGNLVVNGTTISNATYTYTLPTATGTLALTSQLTNGTVTSVTGTSPIVSSGGTTPAISIPAATSSVNGYLSSTDWSTFNNKGSGTVTSVAALTLGTSGTDLSSTVANGTTTPVITLNVPTASATNRGALSSTDWTTFNGKQNALTNPTTGTGTANYHAKFTGSTTLGNSLIWDNGTNVGINTASPESIANNTTLQIDGTNHSFVRTGTSNYGGYFFTIPTADAMGLSSVRNPVTGTFSNTGKAGSAIVLFGTSGNGYMSFSTSNANNAAPTEAMRIFSDGNTLIQTGGTFTNAGYKLDVNGTGRFGASTYKMLSISDAGGAGWATTGGASTAPQIYMYNTGTSAIVQTYINNTARLEVTNTGISVTGAATFSGNVGIGTTTPSYPLHLKNATYSQLFIEGGTTADLILYNSGGSANTRTMVMRQTSSNYLTFFSANDNGTINTNNILTLTNSGNVGIGTTSPSGAAGLAFALNSGSSQGRIAIKTTSSGDASGDGLQIGMAGNDAFIEQRENADLTFATNATERIRIFSTGSVNMSSLGTGTVTASSGTLSTVSDSSYKISDGFIEDALPSVMNLKPRYFYWKDKSGLDTTIRQLGFYAQEVNSAIGEEAANTPKKDSPWGINDRSVIAMLTKAIQEQQAQIKELQTEIQTLKNK